MAAKIEIGIIFNEDVGSCEIVWESFNTADFSPMEKSTLEQIKKAIINQLDSGIGNSHLH